MEDNGFAFSQDLNNLFSHGSQGLGMTQTQDTTWYSENNSQTVTGPSVDQEISRPSVNQIREPVPVDQLMALNQSFPAKRPKFTQPKWAKGLLKTAEENQKQRDIGQVSHQHSIHEN